MTTNYVEVFTFILTGFALGYWFNKRQHRSRITREGKLPKQSQALRTEAENEATTFAASVHLRAREVARELPPINEGVVDESLRVMQSSRWNLEPLFHVLDALSLKVLLVDKTKWKRAIKLLHDAGISTLPLIALIAVATTKTTVADGYEVGQTIKTEAVKLRSFLMGLIV